MQSSQTFNLKEVFNQGYSQSKGFKFEIVYSNSGMARIYVNDIKTKYVTGGYGYDKESSCISNMINDLISKQPYSKDIYGNTCNYSNNTESTGLLCGGTGLSSIKESFESIDGNKLNKIYSGKNSEVFEIVFNQEGVK